MLLEVRNLSVSYNGIRAVSNVSFQVEKGRIVTIIGANGAGKTTIMNTLSGILRPESGKIYFQGEPIHQKLPHAIVEAGIAHVPEGRGIFGNLTVLENLEVAATVPSARLKFKESLPKVLELFPRLKERLKQPAGTLSGGEQQMLAVGRAWVTGGELLLLDEPSMGLAPGMVEDIFNVIQRMNQDGTTILLVEQNAFKAMSIASEAHVLETGMLVLSGPTSELKLNPKVKEAYLGG